MDGLVIWKKFSRYFVYHSIQIRAYYRKNASAWWRWSILSEMDKDMNIYDKLLRVLWGDVDLQCIVAI